MARALHAYGEPIITDAQGHKHDWRVELTQKLATLQHPDGSFSGDQRWMEGDPVLVTSYCVLALQEIRQDLKAHPTK
jgi:squalene-hopene/tetraprenyl-beta-curcumene cyclase